MGLTALLLLQHARASARLDADGAIILLDDQNRGLWDRDMIAEGRLKPVIHSVRPLAELAISLRELIERKVIGKAVLTV